MDYKTTLNLPKTDFPMKADLARREPDLLAFWEQTQVYPRTIAKAAGWPSYILHDGPPYANGRIHIGHALNKILKDIIVKSKAMTGCYAPYVPGWDCHGLPIEHQVMKELGNQATSLSQAEIRRRCRAYAEQYLNVQREEFKRLGLFGDWAHPYATMDPTYEAAILLEFAKCVAGGSVYRGKKPVLWCPSCETALAEAEVEYEDRVSPSIYVKFRVKDDPLDRLHALKGKRPSFVIWTTTPWTLVGNQAVCLHPDFEYQAVSAGHETWIIAKDLVEPCLKEFGITEYDVVSTYRGTDLEHVVCRSPLADAPTEPDWTSKVILGHHVTLDQGTGCVHTAPGHGQEDYEVGLKYNLPIFAPVDGRGRFTDEVNPRVKNLAGVWVYEADKWIVTRLKKEIGTLVKDGTIAHSYPHCWRCKNPVIFRATEQWFISMENRQLRDRALAEIENVNWVPRWGRDRIVGMMTVRPDWCISRQRAWGVPIPAFTCRACQKPLLDAGVIEHLAHRVEKEGMEVWFTSEAKDLLPQEITCPTPQCGGRTFEKAQDILDVWFESGVSHAAVLKSRSGLGWPADLYLEGSDQHRGWFHSTLLAALAAGADQAPYRTVLTHGFVVDGEGKKMSKSAGNVIAPQEIIEQYGAEILRLWVAAEDYRNDVRLSRQLLTQLTEAYRKIRNTCRFLLANLSDFDPGRHHLDSAALTELDRWTLYRLQLLIQRVQKAYDAFEFHVIFHALTNFCAVDLSALYLDIVKDRLYCGARDDPERRAAQAVLAETVAALARLMAPILSFTAEDIWLALPPSLKTEGSVHLTSLPRVEPRWIDEVLAGRWDRLLKVREAVMAALETARKDKRIGGALEAAITLHVSDPSLLAFLKPYERDLPTLFIVSAVQFQPSSAGEPSLRVEVRRAVGAKCERCWMYRPTVGQSAAHPTLCERCVAIVPAA